MFLVVGALGALAGAVGLSVITLLLYALFEPDIVGGSQFAIVFGFTAQFGVLLGSTTALAVRQTRLSHRLRAGVIAAVGGAATLALATAFAWGSASSGGGGFAEFMSTLVSLWVGPSWLAAAALCIWGTRQMMRRW